MTNDVWLDDIEYKQFGRDDFNAATQAVDDVSKRITPVSLVPESFYHLSLNGDWQLVSSQTARSIDKLTWNQAIVAQIPETFQTTLFRLGLIADPTFARNQEQAREYSYRHLYYRKVVHCDMNQNNLMLTFEGVANRCEIYCNGELVKTHEGMFGIEAFDIKPYCRADGDAEIVVHVLPADFLASRSWYPGNNDAWKRTVVMNNVYGWHYSNIPTIGIWNSVHIETQLEKSMATFLATQSLATHQIKLFIESDALSCEGAIVALRLTPKNFSGPSFATSWQIKHNHKARGTFTFAFDDVKSWWPNGMGAQNLYQYQVQIFLENQLIACDHGQFGFRTVTWQGLTDEAVESQSTYKWGLWVNDRPVFIKGAGWCTMDALLNYPASRYHWFLSLAKQQHVNMVRAWGGGIPEAEAFYAACDELGIMVFQEWPTAWNSDRTQPLKVLAETVELNTRRIRKHPALVMYCGGNESDQPFGEGIKMLGRQAYQLDGTRPFHRSEPFGGSIHDHSCYWEDVPLDHYLTLNAPFLGEFGFPSWPNEASVKQFVAPIDLHWPPSAALVYHTPVMGHADDARRMAQVSGYLTGDEAEFSEKIIASQVIQGLATTRVIDHNRACYPQCGGTIYYKLNDNYPAASWSTIDWYGVPKQSYYMLQHAYAPIRAVLHFNRLDLKGVATTIPINVLNDDQRLQRYISCDVHVTVFDQNFQVLVDQFASVSKHEFHRLVIDAGEIHLSRKQANSELLLFRVDLIGDDDEIINRTVYYENFQPGQRPLFELPKASLQIKRHRKQVVIQNIGTTPAVGVSCMSATKQRLVASDGHMWIDSGETIQTQLSADVPIDVSGLNVEISHFD